MSSPVVTIVGFKGPDNTARFQRFVGTLTIGPSGATYPAETGGIPIEAAFAAAFSPDSSSGPVEVTLYTTLASGYVYTYLPTTGKLQILVVPPTGSLTTSSPLQQLGSNSGSLSQVANDVIGFDVTYERNL